MQTIEKNYKVLHEVSLIRPIIITLLVVMHCFTIYNGHWKPIDGIGDCLVYKWLARIVSGFRIETITICAGYVFAFQVFDLHKQYQLISFAKKKFFRLILPCYFFGLIYYFAFKYDGSQSLLNIANDITSGTGHLWFLPMLFWCFCLLLVIHKFRPNEFITFCLLSVFQAVNLQFPLGFARVPHYIFYMYLGYLMWKYHEQIVGILLKKRIVLLLSIVYLTCVIINFQFFEYSKYLTHKLISISLEYIYRLAGILVFYLIAYWLIYGKQITLPNWILMGNKLCYGIYIYHQFFLVYLYYHTNIPQILGTYWLPWVAFSIVYPLTLLCSYYTLKTKFGRFLIG